MLIAPTGQVLSQAPHATQASLITLAIFPTSYAHILMKSSDPFVTDLYTQLQFTTFTWKHKEICVSLLFFG